MKTYVTITIALLASMAAESQSKALVNGTTVTDPSSGITWTPHGDDHLYNPEKNYTVFKLWNQKDPLTEKERSDLAEIKTLLEKKNIELVVAEWKSKEDIEKILKDHGIENVTVSTNNGLSLRTGDGQVHKTVYKKNGDAKEGMTSYYSTDSNKPVLIFEGKFPLEAKRPVGLCAGKICETEFLKTFFNLM